MPANEFLGRQQLLKWLNDALDTNYLNIEALSDGVAFLRLLALYFPGQVPLAKIKRSSERQVEKEMNWLLLQRCLKAVEATAEVDIHALAGGNFRALLTLLRWMNGFLTAQPSAFVKDRDSLEGDIPALKLEDPIEDGLTTVLFHLRSELLGRLQNLKSTGEVFRRAEGDRKNLFETLRSIEHVCEADEQTATGERLLQLLARTTPEFSTGREPREDMGFVD